MPEPLSYYPAFERIAATAAAAAELEHEYWTLVVSLADEFGPDAERVAAAAFGDLIDLVATEDGAFVPVEEPDYDAWNGQQEQREIERLDQREAEREAEDQP
jgi:hypothetical protein